MSKRLAIAAAVGVLVIAAIALSPRGGREPKTGATTTASSTAAAESDLSRGERERASAGPHAPEGVQAASAGLAPGTGPTNPAAAHDHGRAADDPGLARVRAAKSDPSPSGTAALIALLESDDTLLVVEAADGLVARRATSALRPLAKIDIRKSADIAPTIIDSLGKLGGMAKGDEREAAVDRLIALLAQEKTRGARDSLGNVIQIYEALGDTKHPKAAPVLEAELRDPTVARAAKNAAVVSLGRIAAPSSRAPLVALQAASSQIERDAFEEQLRIELLEAIDNALRAIP